MSEPRWPYPGDSPVVRARRVALFYRSKLAELDETACAVADEQVQQWGQGWAVVSLLSFDLDDWLTPRQAAGLASVQVRHIAFLRRSGRLPGMNTSDGWRYLARDVLASLSHRPRTRGEQQ